MPRQKCVVCVKRVREVPRSEKHCPVGACYLCWRLTGLEGTREQYGLPKELPSDRAAKEFLALYNRLAKVTPPMSYAAMAPHFGVAPGVLRGRVKRLREAGYKMEPHPIAPQSNAAGGVGRPFEEPVVAYHRDGTLKAHGEGKYGIRKCRCELCLTVRRATAAKKTAETRRKLREQIVASGKRVGGVRHGSNDILPL